MHMSRISSAPAPGTISSVVDAVARRRPPRRGCGSRPAGTPTGGVSNRPAREEAGERASGGAGEVLRSKRRTWSTGMPKRSATPSSVASQLYEAGSVGERHGERARAHRAVLRGRRRPSKRTSTASRWASRPSASARVRIVGPQRREPLARDPLHLVELAERLDGERAAGAGEAAGRQDVVRARGVVAGRLRRPAADEDRAGVADARRRRASRSATSTDRCSGP